jgi:hypothetical protein
MSASICGAIRQPEGAVAVDRTIVYNTVDAKLWIFWGPHAIDDVHLAPADTKLGRGHVVMGLGKGSGVLSPGVKHPSLPRMHQKRPAR